MSFDFWQVQTPEFEKVRAVMAEHDPSYADVPTPKVVFCAKPGQQGLAEVMAWIEEFGAQCRVEMAGSFAFFEFSNESDAVAFKLRWYVR